MAQQTERGSGGSPRTYPEDSPWKDEEKLRDLYHNDGLSSSTIANRYGVSRPTILYWMDKFGIERRNPKEAAGSGSDHHSFNLCPSIHTTVPAGYERVYGGPDSPLVGVHQLVVIAEGANPALVFSDGEYHVHHRNNIPWDNRPSNLELVTRDSHIRKTLQWNFNADVSQRDRSGDLGEGGVNRKEASISDTPEGEVQEDDVSREYAQMDGDGYKDAETLEYLYHEKSLTQEEIGDIFGVTGSCISDWLSRHEIETRGYPQPDVEGAPWKDELTLRRLYVKNGLGTPDIAEKFETTPETIIYWLEKFGIERRDGNETVKMNGQHHARTTHPTFRDSERGYTVVTSRTDGQRYRFYIHQLVAIADGAEPQKLFSGDGVVHHRNGVKWDNRPSNLEVVSRGEHTVKHIRERMRRFSGGNG
jgi:transposase